MEVEEQVLSSLRDLQDIQMKYKLISNLSKVSSNLKLERKQFNNNNLLLQPKYFSNQLLSGHLARCYHTLQYPVTLQHYRCVSLTTLLQQPSKRNKHLHKI